MRFKWKHVLPWEIAKIISFENCPRLSFFKILTHHANTGWLHYSWGARNKEPATHVNVLPAEEMRPWPCNWSWLHTTTRSNLVTLNIFLWWGGHNFHALSYSFSMIMEQMAQCMTLVTGPHWIETSRAQPTHPLDSTPFFLKLCAGTYNISHSYLHWGFHMTQVAMNNKAAWDPWEGIPFFI